MNENSSIFWTRNLRVKIPLAVDIKYCSDRCVIDTTVSLCFIVCELSSVNFRVKAANGPLKRRYKSFSMYRDLIEQQPAKIAQLGVQT